MVIPDPTKLKIALGTIAMGLTAAALAIGASPAAAARLSPVSHDFGNQSISTSGAPQAFSLTAGCNLELLGSCATPEMLNTSISVGSGEFSQTNNCPAVLVGSVAGVSCTINVTFSPQALGGRHDTLRTGGPTATLTGEGVLPKRKGCQKKGKKRAGASKKKCKKKKKGKLEPVIEPL